jgi:hypothetical protein
MTPEALDLKRATGELIKGVGGLEAAAEFCRVGKSVLGDNQSPNRPDSFIALDVIADLEPLARERSGWPHVTSALCRRMGGTFVALPERPATTTDIFGLLAALSKKMADTTGLICKAMSDGCMDRDEALAVHSEVDAQIAVAAEMRSLLKSVIEGDGA